MSATGSVKDASHDVAIAHIIQPDESQNGHGLVVAGDAIKLAIQKSILLLEKASAGFPHGRFQRIADAGHLVVMEQPKEILRLIETFVESVR